MADLNEEIAQDVPPGGQLDALDMIAIEALGAEADADAAQEAILNPDPEPVVDQAVIWAQISAALGGLLGMAMPELKEAYTPEACAAWGQGMAAVAQKYEWDAAETVSKWAPEFMLLAASLPLVVPTVRAVKARKTIADAKDKARTVDGVAGPQDEQAGPIRPMDMPPGNFSEPV